MWTLAVLQADVIASIADINLNRFTGPTDAEWTAHVKGPLKTEIEKREFTYEQLAERLKEAGVMKFQRILTIKPPE